MGSPELPENEDDSFYAVNLEHQLPDPAEDSEELEDAEVQEGHNGYQLLATDDTTISMVQPLNTATSLESTTPPPATEAVGEQKEEKVATDLPPPPPSLEGELLQEIWNRPRPQELGIDLDSTKTNQILNAMANFRPANLTLPRWAENVSEEHWKQELLQRIRLQKQSNADKCSNADSN